MSPQSSSNPFGIDARMLKFIHQHHLLTLATTDGAEPWCCSCYYTYRPEQNIFVFSTDLHTLHAQHMAANPRVAANIALETKIPGKIRGIQISGRVEKLEGQALSQARKAYILAFPIAALMETCLWALHPHKLKMTDNRMGFGKKLLWEASKPA